MCSGYQWGAAFSSGGTQGILPPRRKNECSMVFVSEGVRKTGNKLRHANIHFRLNQKAGRGYVWLQGKGSSVAHLGRSGWRGANFASRGGGQYCHCRHLRRLHVALQLWQNQAGCDVHGCRTRDSEFGGARISPFSHRGSRPVACGGGFAVRCTPCLEREMRSTLRLCFPSLAENCLDHRRGVVRGFS